jgi:GT2 family glycosyltransferase
VCDELQARLSGLADVMLRLHGKNLGFAAGHNRNIREILAASRPDFIWLLNNDCLVEPGCINALLNCASKNPDVGIWGATLIDADGQTIQCAGGCFYNSWLSTYRPHGHGNPVSKLGALKEAEFSYVAGASLFFPVGTIESGLLPPRKFSRVGADHVFQWLNESFFLYFEEMDLARRLKLGLGLGWCCDAKIIHAGGQAAGTSARRRSALAEYHSALSALKFTRLYNPHRLWIMAPARYLLKSTQLLFTGNFRLIKPVNSAYREFLKWLQQSRA